MEMIHLYVLLMLELEVVTMAVYGTHWHPHSRMNIHWS